jgi:hypothetical protein
MELVLPREDGIRGSSIDDPGYRAYQLHLQGKDWETVAKETGYQDGYVAQVDVRKYIHRAALEMDRANKLEVIGIELARLDALQNAVWDDAMEGDTKAVDAVLKVMSHRAKLLGLEVIAAGASELQQAKTVIIQGNSEEYIKALTLVESDA